LLHGPLVPNGIKIGSFKTSCSQDNTRTWVNWSVINRKWFLYLQ